jgi:glutathione S-transferase
MLKIWGRNNSNNVKKVLWACHELGLAYDRVDAGLHFGVVDTPQYRALNPNGLVPVIEDEGLVLWESNAIVRYLAARHGEGALWPHDPGARALADRWMDWTSGTLAPAQTPAFLNTVRLPPEKRDESKVAPAVAKSAELWAIPEALLADQPYLSGNQLGMGDIPLGVFAHTWFAMPVARPPLPALEAWYRRLLDRPAYRETVALPLS